MKKIATSFLLLLMILSSSLKAQHFGEEEFENPYQFGFKINTTAYGQTVSCAILYKNPYGSTKVNYIPMRSWTLQFLGYENSQANPKRENLAKKYNVFEVPKNVKAQGDAEIKEYSIQRLESILRNLWRLRYSVYPFDRPPAGIGKGWANHPDTNVYYIPSNEQFKILETYGVKTINDFFRGKQAFRLLRDMLDKTWQANYAQGRQSLND